MIIHEKAYCSRCLKPMEQAGPCPFCGYDSRHAPSFPFALEERTVLKNRYLLGAVIGAGGFGITYAAWDKVLGTPVAIKEYFPRDCVTRDIDESDDVLLLPGDENLALFRIGLDRFLREAQLLAMLSSVPGIVSVHDYFEANDTAYIVMEYLRGETLGDYYQREKPAYPQLLSMLRQPIDALIACHKQGVLHRDISPDNLFVLEDGSVKLIDFGAAARMERQAQGKDQSVLLRRSFAPLEQYEKEGNQGPWTDVYALCATLYALLHGEPAPEAPLRSLHSSLPGLSHLPIKKDQKTVLDRGMAIQAKNRIQNMEELRARLYHLPLPEEILQRRRLIRKFAAYTGAASLIISLLIANFLIGLPLGNGILYSLRSNGLQVMSIRENQETLSLPAARLGIPVSSISQDAFRFHQSLRSVTLPGSLSSIPENAFQGCSALETVALDEGISALEARSFADCKNLHSLYLPSSLKKIHATALEGTGDQLFLWGTWQENGAVILALGEEMGRALPFGERTEFGIEENDTGLTLLIYRRNYETDELQQMMAPYQQALSTVILPSYIDGLPVTQVHPDALGMDAPNWITSLTFPRHMETIHAWSGGILMDAHTELHYGDEVKKIAEGAFENYPDASIILPPRLTTIEKRAFANSALQSIILPDSVIFIGEAAFDQCQYMREAQLPAGLKSIENSTFMNCTALQSIILPEGMERIGESAFWGCTSLEYLYLPSTVKKIEAAAFLDCSALRYIYLPPEAQIDDLAFRSQQTLFTPDIIIAGHPGSPAESYAAACGFPFEDVTRWNVFADPNQPGTIVIDADNAVHAVCASFDPVNHVPVTRVSSIVTLVNANPSSSFIIAQTQRKSYSPLESVELPLFTQTIDASAFQYCEKLSSVHFPDNIQRIRSEAFSHCGLKSITLPSNLLSLESPAFHRCENLISLTIPDDILLRKITGFEGNRLENLEIPSVIRVIEDAFNDAKALKTLTLQEGCREISDSFRNTVALEQIIFPASLEKLNNSFLGATSLKDIYFLNPDTQITYALRAPFADCAATIHGHAGSTAENYALEHGLSFEALPSGI